MKKSIIYFITSVIVGIIIYYSLKDLEQRNLIMIIWSTIMIFFIVLDHILSRILNTLKKLKKSLSDAQEQANKDNS